MRVGIDARCLAQPLAGIGRYTLEMCKALLRRGDVSLYLYSPSPIPHNILDQLQGAVVNVPFEKISLRNKVYRQLWSEIYLPLRVKQDQIDIFWGPAHHLPFLLSSTMPRVVTIHDLVWKFAGETMRPLSRLFEKIRMPHAVQKADRIVADSHATKTDVLAEFMISEDVISVVHLGRSKPEATPSQELLKSLNIQSSYFLFVGTIEPRKNLERLLRAYSQLSRQMRDKTQLVIAGGSGWGKVRLIELIDELDLSENVVVLGYVEDETLKSLYAHARFLAMPSLYEGFGLPLLEAMVCGVPVLTSNNSSMPEIAGEGGVFVDPLNLESIKEGLRQLLEDDVLRADLSAKALINVERFSWERAGDQLLDIFKDVLRNKGGTIS